MSDDVRDRAREILAGVGSPCGDAIGGIGAREAVSLLDAAGIALVDLNELISMRGYKVIAENAMAKLKIADAERQRLLAFRDAFDRMVFSIGSGADERYRYDVVRAARAAVADIESEGDHANVEGGSVNTITWHAAVQRERKPVCCNCYGEGVVYDPPPGAIGWEPRESWLVPCDVCAPRLHGPWPDEGMYEEQDISDD